MDYPSLALTSTVPRRTWDLSKNGKDRISIAFSPRYVTDDMAALALAAQNSVGIVQLPLYMVQDELRTGSLVPLVPDWQPLAGIIHAVFSSRRGQSPAMRSFVDFIAAAFFSKGNGTHTTIAGVLAEPDVDPKSTNKSR